MISNAPTNLGREEPLQLTSFNLANVHERDSHVHFYPDCHAYTYDDIPAEAVSTIIGSWFPTFDAEHNAQRKATPDHPKQQYLEEWESRGNEARATGTFMHAQIEQTLLGQPNSDVFNFRYNGQYVKLDRNINISHELKAFQRFMDKWKPTPYRTEWRICDEEHRMAGTIDFLAQNDAGDFIMFDWKRSNKIGTPEALGFQPCRQNPFHRTAYGLLAHLDDMPYNHYCLQQNLYRYMLGHHYGIHLSAMYLVVLHPDYPTYHVVPVPVMEPEVRTILSRLR